MNVHQFISVIIVATLLGVATMSFAESAPVYDVDSMQQQFDDSSNPADDLPPPPAPDQEGSVNRETTIMPTQAPSSLSLDQRVRRVEQQITNIRNNTTGSQVETLQTEVQSLRGQVEQLTHELQQLQSAQKSLLTQATKMKAGKIVATAEPTKAQISSAGNEEESKSLPGKNVSKAADKTSAHATKSESLAAATPKEETEQPNLVEEQQIYQTAYDLIKAKKYSDAVNTLQNMLKKYPSGQFASNAHYWLGELYGLMGKNNDALREFNIVVTNYPDSPRISDAQLKVGLIYASQLRWPDAKSAFKKVVKQYPGTASARLATEQLKQISQVGH